MQENSGAGCKVTPSKIRPGEKIKEGVSIDGLNEKAAVLNWGLGLHSLICPLCLCLI